MILVRPLKQRPVQALDTRFAFPNRGQRLAPLPRPPVTDRRNAPRPSVRFREAIPDYLALLEASGQAQFAKASLRRWVDRWAGVQLVVLTPDDLQEYLASLALLGHSFEEIEKEKSLLRSFYRWANRCGWTAGDPTVALSHTRPVPEPPAVALSATEQQQLLDACRGRFPASARSGSGTSAPNGGQVPHYLYPLVLLGLRTGLRLGNLLNLEWRHVDLVQRRIRIPASEIRSAREVDLPLEPDAHTILFRLLRLARDLPSLPERVLDTTGLPSWRGRPDEKEVLRVFRLVRKRAGLPDLGFNSLRLTFLRNCAGAGVPIEDALRMCDWDEAPEAVYDLFAGRPSV